MPQIRAPARVAAKPILMGGNWTGRDGEFYTGDAPDACRTIPRIPRPRVNKITGGYSAHWRCALSFGRSRGGVMLVLAALLAVQQANPFDAFNPQPGPTVVWSSQTVDGDRFWIESDEVERARWGTAVWMHGEHHLNRAVKYRTSLWRIQFFCDGTYQVVASSTFDAAGHQISSWDGVSVTTHIRPGTIYQEIEKQFCP
jgi:hypothetical protein